MGAFGNLGRGLGNFSSEESEHFGVAMRAVPRVQHYYNETRYALRDHRLDVAAKTLHSLQEADAKVREGYRAAGPDARAALKDYLDYEGPRIQKIARAVRMMTNAAARRTAAKGR